MKRLLISALAIVVCAASFAQGGPFTIRRPLDGAKVREVVAIRVPKTSVPNGAYFGIYVNGKFLEAAMPVAEGNDFVYRLDTQARGIADGETTLEVVLFQEFQDRPRIINRSSVKVTVENKASIPIPAEGVRFRYQFRPGEENKYSVTRRQTVSLISRALAQVGGRGAEQSIETENFRLMYAVDNAYRMPNGERQGLIRIQALPDKGKDTASLVLDGQTEAREYQAHEMAPVYMRVTDTGREVFGSSPSFFGWEGGVAGETSRTDLLAAIPLPTLSTDARRPGGSWSVGILMGTLDLDNRDEVARVSTTLPGRGTFEGVEWRDGRPTAKIRNVLSVGARDLQNVRNLNQIDGEAVRVEVEQLFWFDLGRGRIVRSEINFTQESLVEVGGGSGGGSGGQDQGGGGGQSGGPSRAGAAGAGGGPATGGANAGWTLPQVRFQPRVNARGDLSLFQMMGPGGGRQGGAGGGDELEGRGGGQGARGGGAPGAGTQILRVRQSIILELER